MKYLLTTLSLLLSFNTSFSQNDSLVYYRPCFYSQYLLDSLNVPFIPLDLRSDSEYVNYERIKQFNDFFNGDLVYLPDSETSSYHLLDYEELFGEYYRYLLPDGVVGESFIELDNHPKYGLLRIIESFNINKESEKSVYYFNTTLYGLDYEGNWDMIVDPDISVISDLPKFNKSYME